MVCKYSLNVSDFMNLSGSQSNESVQLSSLKLEFANLTLKQQKLLNHNLPYGAIYIDAAGRYVLLRNSSSKPQQFDSLNVLLSTVSRVKKTYDKEVELAKAYGAKVLTSFDDFSSNESPLTYQCADTDCGYEWTKVQRIQRADFTSKLISSKWKGEKKLQFQKAVKANSKYLMCPECYKKHIVESILTEPLTAKYKRMSDEELIKVANQKSSELQKDEQKEGVLQKIFVQKNAALYNEMKIRASSEDGKKKHAISLFDEFSLNFGWRRLRPELKAWGLEEYKENLKLLKINDCVSWRLQDVHSYNSARKCIFFKELKAWLNSRLYLCGVFYDSYAEFVVAKLLKFLDVEFIAHAKWPFSYLSDKHKMIKDFEFNYQEKNYSIEVLMVTRDELKDEEAENDKFLLDYVQRSEYKFKQVAKIENTTLIKIHARKLKQARIGEYIDHIFDQLDLHNIVFPRCNESQIELNSSDFTKWQLTDWLSEARINGWKQLTDMPQTMQHYLCQNQTLQKEFHIRLCDIHELAYNTRFGLVEFEVFENYLLSHPSLWSKEAYAKAHKAKELPFGFPQSPLHSFGKGIFEVVARGPRIDDYFQAKALVQKFNLRSKADFHAKRKSTEQQYLPLRRIRSCPGNQHSGGYTAFEGWPKFLGYERNGSE